MLFVIENNYQGQLAALIRSVITEKSRIVESITKFDGASFKPKEITGAITSYLASKIGT